MAIAITTLNDGTSAVAHSYSRIGGDLATSEWYDTTGTANGRDGRLFIRQQKLPVSNLGKSMRRTNVQVTAKVPVSTTIAGTSKTVEELVTVNFTITAPTSLNTAFAANELRDMVGQVKSFLSDANLAAIARGEV